MNRNLEMIEKWSNKAVRLLWILLTFHNNGGNFFEPKFWKYLQPKNEYVYFNYDEK